MENRHLIAKVGAESPREDRRQRDFRHQHHRRPPLSKCRSHRADIDFGFAAARHTVEQEGRIAPLYKRCFDLFQRLRLSDG
jgi:hypothetical protein